MIISKKNSVWSSMVAAMLLGGCAASNTERDFLCPVQDGSPCSTISAADGANGAIPTPVREQSADTLNKDLSQQPLGINSGKGAQGSTGGAAFGDGGSPYYAAKYRVPEEVGTLWIAPHQDNDGLLYEASYVHFVVREPYWASK